MLVDAYSPIAIQCNRTLESIGQPERIASTVLMFMLSALWFKLCCEGSEKNRTKTHTIFDCVYGRSEAFNIICIQVSEREICARRTGYICWRTFARAVCLFGCLTPTYTKTNILARWAHYKLHSAQVRILTRLSDVDDGRHKTHHAPLQLSSMV